jgi:acyl-CoA thioester hydrolase
MGFMYYGNYPQYFEVARAEGLRDVGLTYKTMEDSGVGMPVAQMDITYKRPAKYDDLLTVKTTINELPTSKIIFHHEVYNEQGELLTLAKLVLVFMNIETKRPTRCPQMLLDKMLPYFN